MTARLLNVMALGALICTGCVDRGLVRQRELVALSDRALAKCVQSHSGSPVCAAALLCAKAVEVLVQDTSAALTAPTPAECTAKVLQ